MAGLPGAAGAAAFGAAAFFVDNMLMVYQFSFAVDYFKDRMRIFLGEDKLDDPAAIEHIIMKFIRKALKA